MSRRAATLGALVCRVLDLAHERDGSVGESDRWFRREFCGARPPGRRGIPLRNYGLTTLAAALALGCQGLDRFDTTNGAAYCGQIVDAEFIRSTGPGGFGRLNLCLQLDTGKLDTTPGNVTTDDAADGPCAPKATFDHSTLEVPSEVVSDAMSAMQFGDGQIENLVAWTSSTCRGPALAIVSLYRNDRVEVRLMKPPGTDPTAPGAGEGFALFQLERSAHGF